MKPSLKGQRLAAVFLLGCLALNYPLLSLFARDVEILGVPLLYAYIFIVWGLLIGLLAWVVEAPDD